MNRALLLLLTVLGLCSIAAMAPIPDGEFENGPVYSPAPETKVHDGVPKGTVQHLTMNSADSKAYPADPAGKPFTRDVWVYIPAGYAAGTEVPLLIVHDGGNYRGVITRTLDNLIDQHAVPAMVAVMVNPGPGKQRSIEYDTVSPKYADFLEDEVLPKVASEYQIKFTKDPDKRASFGTSSGGAASFTMAWFRTNLYHRVITYSGSFTALRPTPDAPHGAWEYAEHLIPETDAKPIRVTLQVGDHDVGEDRPEESHMQWESADRHMAAALEAKGYHYRFEFSKDAKHVAPKVIEQTLPTNLTWAWQN